MPPIPPRSPSLSEKANIIVSESIDQSTTALILSIKRLQHDILNFQIPRLRSIVTDNSSTVNLATHQRYAAELRTDLEKFSAQVEEVELRVDDEPRRKDREEVRRFADEFNAICLTLRQEMRSVVLDSKRAIEARGKSNRELLIGSVISEKSLVTKEESGKEKTSSGDDAVMVEKDNVTEALRRTIGQMQNELERSVLSVQLLEQSTQTLQRTSTTHDTLHSLTEASKTLIKALEHADMMDRLLIIGSLIFFFLVVAFILRERVLMRGVRGIKGVGRFVGWGFKGVLRTGERSFSVQDILSTIPSASETSLSSSVVQSLHLTAASVSVAKEDSSVVPTLSVASAVMTTVLSSISPSIHVEL